MKRCLFAGAVSVFALVLLLDSNSQGGDKDKVTIKVVMKKAMAGGLCKKVVTGKASADEKKQLIELFTALAANTPPMGEAESWKKRTKALLDAAKADDGAALKKAADCGSCHTEFKKKKS